MTTNKHTEFLHNRRPEVLKALVRDGRERRHIPEGLQARRQAVLGRLGRGEVAEHGTRQVKAQERADNLTPLMAIAGSLLVLAVLNVEQDRNNDYRDNPAVTEQSGQVINDLVEHQAPGGLPLSQDEQL